MSILPCSPAASIPPLPSLTYHAYTIDENRNQTRWQWCQQVIWWLDHCQRMTKINHTRSQRALYNMHTLYDKAYHTSYCEWPCVMTRNIHLYSISSAHSPSSLLPSSPITLHFHIVPTYDARTSTRMTIQHASWHRAQNNTVTDPDFPSIPNSDSDAAWSI